MTPLLRFPPTVKKHAGKIQKRPLRKIRGSFDWLCIYKDSKTQCIGRIIDNAKKQLILPHNRLIIGGILGLFPYNRLQTLTLFL